jgi:hypothetical protein
MAAHRLVQQWRKSGAAGEERGTTHPYHWRLSDRGRRLAKQIGWLIEEEIGVQRGFFTYFIEDIAVCQDAYRQALGQLAERD